MSVSLTEGAVEALLKGSQVDNPVLQLLNIRQITTATGPARFRLMMSDGQHYWSSFLLATQVNHLAEEKLLPNCVCKLKKTTTNTLSDGRHVVVVIDLDVLQSAEETGGKIGNPTPFNTDDKTASPQKSVSSTSVSPSPPAAAVPGPSFSNSTANSTLQSGFVGKPPMKASAMSESPSKFSPMKASPSKFSPMKASPSKFSPMQTSPSKFSPMKDSPSKFSPIKTSPYKFSPMKTSPSKFSPKASPGSSPGSSAQVNPIAGLNPYQSKWTIRARVANKSNVRTWSNSKGEGKLFSFEVVDKSGEIKITAFNKEVDKFFSLVEQGKVYYISKATLKPANKQYSTLKNDYEMTLHANSSIIPCNDTQDVPTVHCDFVPISELENKDNDSIIA